MAREGLGYLIGFLGLEGLEQIAPPWWGLIAAVAVVPVALAWFAAFLAREARIMRQHSMPVANCCRRAKASAP